MSMEWIDYIITKNGTYVGADEAEANIATLQAKMHSMQCCYLESLNQARALSITQLEAAHATIATLRSSSAAAERIHHGDILHLEKRVQEAETERDDAGRSIADALNFDVNEAYDMSLADLVRAAISALNQHCQCLHMKKDDLLYGLEHWERLEMNPYDVVERVMEDACDKVGEGFDAMASRIDWPIKIMVYKRRDVGGESCAKTIADTSIESALEMLDEEYADHEGDVSDPTDAMKAAALAFGRTVVADYVSWTCEPNGDVIEFTGEQAKENEPIHPCQCPHGKPLDKPCPECDPQNPLYALGVNKTV